MVLKRFMLCAEAGDKEAGNLHINKGFFIRGSVAYKLTGSTADLSCRGAYFMRRLQNAQH